MAAEYKRIPKPMRETVRAEFYGHDNVWARYNELKSGGTFKSLLGFVPSYHQISRLVRSGPRSQVRKERSDKGNSKIDKHKRLILILRTENAQRVRMYDGKPLIVPTPKTSGGYDSVQIARILRVNDIVDASPNTINRKLREWLHSKTHLDKRRKVFRPREREFANGTHLLDATKLYFCKNIREFRPHHLWDMTKNKPGNFADMEQNYVWAILLVDDHSRMPYCQFYFNDNEINELDHLLHAWTPKVDPETGLQDRAWQFWGVPQILYTDGASQLTSRRFERLSRMLKDLGGDFTHMLHVSDPSKGGKVERVFPFIQGWMKSTYFQPFETLEEANKALYYYCRWVAKVKIHKETGATAQTRWLQSILEHRNRLQAPPIKALEEVMKYVEVEVTVPAHLYFTVNGNYYSFGDPGTDPGVLPYIDWGQYGERILFYYRDDRPGECFCVYNKVRYPCQYFGDKKPVFSVAAAGMPLTTSEQMLVDIEPERAVVKQMVKDGKLDFRKGYREESADPVILPVELDKERAEAVPYAMYSTPGLSRDEILFMWHERGHAVDAVVAEKIDTFLEEAGHVTWRLAERLLDALEKGGSRIVLVDGELVETDDAGAGEVLA